MADYRELNAEQRELYNAALRKSHRVRTTVSLYDRDETYVRRLGGKVVSGQVDVDERNDITRSLSLTIADPSSRFMFDAMGEVYADNFIGVEYGVLVPDLGTEVAPNELTITTDLEAWYKADSLTGTLADGDAVSSWTDSSGNSRTLTQTGTARPTFQTNEQNGKPCLRFDGVDDYLSVTSDLGLDGEDQPWTCFVVRKDTVEAANNAVVFLANSAAADWIGMQMHSSANVNYVTINSGAGESTSTGSGLTTTGSFNIIRTGSSGTAVHHAKNGGTPVTGTINVGDISMDTLYIGAYDTGAAAPSGFLDGDIAEVLIYSRLLGTTEIASVESYLSRKWNISVPHAVPTRTAPDWVDVPVFFGPVSRYTRDGAEVTIEAVGKEALMLPPVKKVALDDTPAGRTLNAYLRQLAGASGEEKFRLGEGRAKKVPNKNEVDPALGNDRGVWWYMQAIAKASGLFLLYSGDGYLELRPIEGTKDAWRFDQALDEPTVSFDLKETRNRVEVWDQDKKGQPDPVVRVELPAHHPLSKESLSRNGQDRILVERVQLDDTKVPIDKARRIARDTLDRMSDGVVDVRFEHVPIPHLELGDRVALDTPRYPDLRFRVRAFTLPLGAGDAMSIGYTRAIRFAPYRNRRVKKL